MPIIILALPALTDAIVLAATATLTVRVVSTVLDRLGL